MHKYFLITASFILLLFLAAAGCGESDAPEQDTTDAGTIIFQENEPVAGWLEVMLPGAPLAMDGSGENIWILTDNGLAMGWNTDSRSWSSLDAAGAFDIASIEEGIAILTPGGLTVLRGEEMTSFTFDESKTPEDVCGTSAGPAVLFQDGSVSVAGEDGFNETVESSGVAASGALHCENGVLAWMNDSGTASIFDITESLLTEVTLPEGTEAISLADGSLLACDGISTRVYRGQEAWEEYSEGTIAESGYICLSTGIALNPSEGPITCGTPFKTDQVIQLTDGTVWSLAESGVAVWGELRSVETRLPDADVQRLFYRMAGQTGTGSGSGDGVGSSGASLGGIFRIYESVSSRPDPFTEFPATSRDLRRPLEDLTIEELHLVGITLDPSGGDQAMVEDANGVAYVLREGTTLRNNTRIAEITGNEVIVVQEVTVGSEDDLGGTTSIPTIFSMRLHEEGGL